MATKFSLAGAKLYYQENKEWPPGFVPPTTLMSPADSTRFGVKREPEPKPASVTDSLKREYLKDPEVMSVAGLKLLGLYKEEKPSKPEKWQAERAEIDKLLARGDIDTTDALRLKAGLSEKADKPLPKWKEENALIDSLASEGVITKEEAAKHKAGLRQTNSVAQLLSAGKTDIALAEKLREKAIIKVTKFEGDRTVFDVDSIAKPTLAAKADSLEQRGLARLDQVYEILGIPPALASPDTLKSKPSGPTTNWWNK